MKSNHAARYLSPGSSACNETRLYAQDMSYDTHSGTYLGLLLCSPEHATSRGKAGATPRCRRRRRCAGRRLRTPAAACGWTVLPPAAYARRTESLTRSAPARTLCIRGGPRCIYMMHARAHPLYIMYDLSDTGILYEVIYFSTYDVCRHIHANA